MHTPRCNVALKNKPKIASDFDNPPFTYSKRLPLNLKLESWLKQINLNNSDSQFHLNLHNLFNACQSLDCMWYFAVRAKWSDKEGACTQVAC